MFFLRPWWLLLLLAVIYILFWYKPAGRSTAWQRVIDPHLLPYLVSSNKFKTKKFTRFFLPVFITLIALALAGPTVTKIPDYSNLIKKPVVIILELSPHMLSTDVSPSRLKRALFKLRDFLQAQPDREVGLIVFAGDAHVVVPVTQDHKTIISLSESLNPTLMPVKGSRIMPALRLAQEMGDNNIIIISSSNISDSGLIKSFLEQNPLSLTFWYFATPTGSPLLTEEGIFAKTPAGEIAMSTLRSDILSQLKNLPNNNSQVFTPDNQDIKNITNLLDNKISQEKSSKKNFYDSWYDLGPYILILAMLVFLAAAITHGPQWYLLCFLLYFPVDPAHASIADWFMRSDQKAYKALKNNKPEEAAELYNDDFNKGTAYFKAKNYAKAIEYLKKSSSSDGFYNLGNAYAHSNKIQEAINAYDQAIKLDPKNSDAVYNKELLEKLKQEQENKQDKQQEQDKNQEQNKQDKQQEQDKNQEQEKQDKQEQAKEHSKQEKQQELDNKTRYYFDHLERNNNLYLKRKFLYESRQKQGKP